MLNAVCLYAFVSKHGHARPSSEFRFLPGVDGRRVLAPARATSPTPRGYHSPLATAPARARRVPATAAHKLTCRSPEPGDGPTDRSRVRGTRVRTSGPIEGSRERGENRGRSTLGPTQKRRGGLRFCGMPSRRCQALRARARLRD